MPTINELRAEVVKTNSMINKRIKRMINRDFYSPALMSLAEQYGYDKNELASVDKTELYEAIKFKVARGADFNDLQKAYWRVKHYQEDKTSDFKGAEEVLNKVAESVGLGEQFSRMKKTDPIKKYKLSKIFFKLYDKMKQYIETAKTKGKAESFNYNEIFKQVNVFFESNEFAKNMVENIGTADIDNIDVEDLLDKMLFFYGYKGDSDFMNPPEPIADDVAETGGKKRKRKTSKKGSGKRSKWITID